MGHALGGALGVCAATGRWAIVLTGDGSLQLMNPLPAAVKHGCLLTLVVLNDSRLGLAVVPLGWPLRSAGSAPWPQLTTSLSSRSPGTAAPCRSVHSSDSMGSTSTMSAACVSYVSA